MNLLPKFLGRDLSGIFLQTYSGFTFDTVTVVPRRSVFDIFGLLMQPGMLPNFSSFITYYFLDSATMKGYIESGVRVTWPVVPLLHHRLRVELRIKKCLEELEC